MIRRHAGESTDYFTAGTPPKAAADNAGCKVQWNLTIDCSCSVKFCGFRVELSFDACFGRDQFCLLLIILINDVLYLSIKFCNLTILRYLVVQMSAKLAALMFFVGRQRYLRSLVRCITISASFNCFEQYFFYWNDNSSFSIVSQVCLQTICRHCLISSVELFTGLF